MITKGIILETPEPNTNKYKVKIPVFQTTGLNLKGTSLDASVVDALLCYEPGNFQGYNVGDVVFLGFEENETSRAVILGKLYIPNEIKNFSSNNFIHSSSIIVDSVATLPESTTIGGIKVSVIRGMLKELQMLKENMINEDFSCDLTYEIID